MTANGRFIRSAHHLKKYPQLDDYYHKESSFVSYVLGNPEAFGMSNDGEICFYRMVEMVERYVEKNIPNGKEKRFGLDVVLSAPKSVSLGCLVAQDASFKAACEAAHAQAAKLTIDYFLSQICVQVKRNGVVIREQSSAVMALGFDHGLSRAKDPDKHTHHFIPPFGLGKDGVVRSLDYGPIMSYKTVGKFYENELRIALERAGIRTRDSKNGFELNAISDEQILKFSKRRVQVLANKQDILADNPDINHRDLEEKAFRKNRGHKDQVVDHQALHMRWEREAAVVALDPATLKLDTSLQERKKDALQHHPLLVRKALEATANNRGMFTVDDVANEARALAADPQGVFLQPGRPPIADLTITHDEVANLLAEHGREWGMLLMPTASDDPRKAASVQWTMTDLLIAEALNRAYAQQGQGALDALYILSDAAWRVDEAAAGMFEFDFRGEQRDAALGILTSRSFVTCIAGDPGTGKTTLLQAVVAAHGREKVITLSKAGAAAQKLGEETRTAAKTIDSFLLDVAAMEKAADTPLKDLTKGERRRAQHAENYLPAALRPGGVIVVDEASMVGSLEAARLHEIASRYGSRMVYVGDRNQLPGVGTGLPFEMMQDVGCPTFKLHEIRRQEAESAEKRAVEAVTLNNAVKESVRILREEGARGEGCVHQVDPGEAKKGQPDGLHKACVQDYLDAVRADREHPLLITSRNADRRMMNEMIREYLVRDGRVEAEQEFSLLDKQKKEHKISLGVGDRVVFLRNDSRRDIKILEQGESKAEQVYNSDQGFITSQEGNSFDVRLTDGRLVRWDPNTYKHVDHAYALSTYKSQGQSVDQRVIYHTPHDSPLLSRNEFLVGISRNKHDLAVYTDDVQAMTAKAEIVVRKKTTLAAWEAGRQIEGHPYAQALGEAFTRRHDRDQELKTHKELLLAKLDTQDGAPKWSDVPRKARDEYNERMNASRDKFARDVRLAKAQHHQDDELSLRLDAHLRDWEAARAKAQEQAGQMAAVNRSKAEITADSTLIRGVQNSTRCQDQGELEHVAQRRIEEARQTSFFAGDQAWTQAQADRLAREATEHERAAQEQAQEEQDRRQPEPQAEKPRAEKSGNDRGERPEKAEAEVKTKNKVTPEEDDVRRPSFPERIAEQEAARKRAEDEEYERNRPRDR